MKVITKSKCCDTIRLEDVDLDKHYLVSVTHDELTRVSIYGRTHDLKFTCIDLQRTNGEACSYVATPKDSIEERITCDEELYAFNTLNEMLDFVKENTSED